MTARTSLRSNLNPCLCLLIAFVLAGVTVHPAVTQESGNQEENGEATPEHRYPVSGIDFTYLRKHPDHPSLEDLSNLKVSLRKTDWGWDAPTEAVSGKEVALDELFSGSEPVMLSAAAIKKVNGAVVDWFNRRDIVSIFADRHPKDITRDGKDVRPDGRTTLRILIHTASIGEIYTKAAGDRFKDREESRNLPEHRWIRKRSPLKPGGEDRPGDLIWKDQMDRYAYHLSRHPGRRVNISVGDAGKGTASLGYRIIESRPWTVYSQVTNTGTENTDEIQERVGFVHNQLTGHDDVFSLDYTTAGFGEDFNDVRTSYEHPFSRGGRTKFSINGGYNEFTASDLGIPDLEFIGESWNAGAGVTHNLYQNGRWFFDVTGNINWEQHNVDNEILGTDETDDFLKPEIRLSMERSNRKANTRGFLSLTRNLADLAGTEEETVSLLGRAGADEDFTILTGQFSQSMYLEPIIYGKDWEDPSTPETSTLAHEIRFSARGQTSFGERLPSQETFVTGGMYSVRGYPESSVSGDSGGIASLEYLFHIPRVFEVEPDPGSLLGEKFRMAPERVFGFPDWDLAMGPFLDYGATDNNNVSNINVAPDEVLMTAGVTTEIQFMRKFRAQLSWGRALKDLENGEAEAGNDEIHFLFQIRY